MFVKSVSPKPTGIPSLPANSSLPTHRTFLAVAIPLALSTLSTPLLGAVDTAVVGRMADPAHIGGIAVGALIFNTMYWLLGFLRVSTSAFSAQASGAGNREEQSFSLMRPMLLALGAGCLFLLLQEPILRFSLWVIHPDSAVAEHSALYYDIRIWGAPAALAHYVMVGWLMGMGRIGSSLYLQIGMNGLNIILDILFVWIFHMGVAGVATATLISEYTALLAGVMLLIRTGVGASLRGKWSRLMDPTPLMHMMQMNRDWFIRTVCLLAVFGMFTSHGAAMGNTVLAANAILFQIHYLMAYGLDGFANAASIFVGRSIGEKNPHLFRRTVRLAAVWGGVVSLILSLATVMVGSWILSWFTDIPQVLKHAEIHLSWVALFPLAAFWGLQLNGIFAGAAQAGPIRNSMLLSLIVFVSAAWVCIPLWNNHGLWLAFLLFSLARTLALWAALPRLTHQVGESTEEKANNRAIQAHQ